MRICGTNIIKSIIIYSLFHFFSLESMDNQVKSTLQKIPLLTIKAGPRDGDMWIKRLKQEYKALIEVLAGYWRDVFAFLIFFHFSM